MPDAPKPLLLVLDGNSLIHRAYFAGDPEGGRPVWALRGMVTSMARAAAQLRPDAVIVGFDCPEQSARKADYPLYKAQRAEKPADLTEQILAAPAMLRDAGVCVIVPPSFEADDVLASAADQARRQGWRSVLMTSDRDAFALLDEATSVLRVRNGGFDEAVLIESTGLLDVCGVQPWQYRDLAALRGDPSDNLEGVRRFGTVTAARLLNAFGTVDAAWAALDDGREESVRAVVGERAAKELGIPAMRENVERNRRLMAMRTDLPVPDLQQARLPLNMAVVRRALSAREINLGPSLWALTGGMPPTAPPDESPFIVKPRSRRDPIPGQLTLF